VGKQIVPIPPTIYKILPSRDKFSANSCGGYYHVGVSAVSVYVRL